MPEKFLAIDAEHGADEYPANEAPDALVRLLRRKRPRHIHWAIGNPRALRLGLRQEEDNLTCVKPDAHGSTEQRRKVVLGQKIAQHAFAFSRHGFKQRGPDYAVCHPNADPIVWHMLATSGIKRLLHPFRMPHHMASLHKNYLLADLGPQSERTAEQLYDWLLQGVHDLDTDKQATYRGERWAYATEITSADAELLKLPDEMTPFEEALHPAAAAYLGYARTPLVPISASRIAYPLDSNVYAECAIPWADAVKML